jgi:hypothetical protein
MPSPDINDVTGKDVQKEITKVSRREMLSDQEIGGARATTLWMDLYQRTEAQSFPNFAS